MASSRERHLVLRSWMKLGFDSRDRSNKSIPPAGQSFYEPRVVGVIAEGITDLVDRGPDGLIELPDSIFPPKQRLQLSACDYFPGVVEQGSEYLKWLSLKPDLSACLP